MRKQVQKTPNLPAGAALSARPAVHSSAEAVPGFADNRPAAAAQLQIKNAARSAASGPGEKQAAVPARQPIQREVILKNADENIYEDSDTGNEIGFLGKSGGKAIYYFADYTGLLNFIEQYEEAQKQVKGFGLHDYVGQFRLYSDYTELYGHIYAITGDGKLIKLTEIDNWTFFQQRLIEVLNRGGPAFWQGGASNRYPRAMGKLAVRGDMSREEVFARLGIPPEKFSTMGHVELYNMTDKEFSEKRSQLLHDQDNVITTDDLLYRSEKTLHRSKNARFKAAGKKYDEKFSAVTENSKLHKRLDKSFRMIGPPVSEGWVTAFNTVPRGEGQEKAMSEWNALGAAAYANRFYGKPFDLNQNWEWLHVRGAQIGGKTLKSNLVAGLYAVNSQMIPYENKIKEMDKKDPGKLKARFYTEGHITGPFAEKINIDIATNGPHAVFGNIPDSKPVSLSFYTTSGKVVDKMMGYIEAFKLNQLVEKNVKGLASPEENRRALVPSYQAHREDVSARFQESLSRSPSSPFMFPSGGMPFPKPEMPSGLGSFGSEIVPMGRPFGDSPFVITPPMDFEFMVPEGFNLFNPTNFEFLNRFMAQVPQQVGLLIETEEGGRLTQTFLGGTRQQSAPEDSSDQSGSFRRRSGNFVKSMLEKSRKLAIGINSQSLIISRAKQHPFKVKIRFMIQQQRQDKGAIVRPIEGFNDK